MTPAARRNDARSALALLDHQGLGVPLPDGRTGTVVVPPPDGRPGTWAGAPSAVYRDGVFHLAYRLRRPEGEGRGYANVVARSTDGVTFTVVATVALGLLAMGRAAAPSEADAAAWALWRERRRR